MIALSRFRHELKCGPDCSWVRCSSGLVLPVHSATAVSTQHKSPPLTVSAIQIFTTSTIWTARHRGTIMEEAGNITDNTGSKLRHKNVYKSKLQALGFNALSHGKVAAGKIIVWATKVKIRFI